MNDLTKMLLWQAGIQIPGLIMGAKGSGDDAAANREIQMANVGTGQANTLAGYYGQQTPGYAAALDSIGAPLGHALQRADFAKKRSFLFDGPGGGPQYIRPQGYMNAYLPSLPRFDSAKPFFSDEAMLASEVPYWQSISALTGGKVGPGFQAAGYSSQPASMAQYAVNQSLWRDANEKARQEMEIKALLSPQQQAVQQALQPEKKKGTPWWKKALGIGGMIGSMFIPGMQALGPVAMGLLRAGVGAASGALVGGKKGALLGGAMGGISSLPISGIQNIPGIGSAPGAKGMTGLKNLFTGNFMGTPQFPNRVNDAMSTALAKQGGGGSNWASALGTIFGGGGGGGYGYPGGYGGWPGTPPYFPPNGGVYPPQWPLTNGQYNPFAPWWKNYPIMMDYGSGGPQ